MTDMSETIILVGQLPYFVEFHTTVTNIISIIYLSSEESIFFCHHIQDLCMASL